MRRTNSPGLRLWFRLRCVGRRDLTVDQLGLALKENHLGPKGDVQNHPSKGKNMGKPPVAGSKVKNHPFGGKNIATSDWLTKGTIYQSNPFQLKGNQDQEPPSGASGSLLGQFQSHRFCQQKRGQHCRCVRKRLQNGDVFSFSFPLPKEGLFIF